MTIPPIVADALAFLAPYEQAVVELTGALVAAPSPNLPGDETAPAAVVRAALNALGLPEPTEMAMEPHRPNLIVRIDAANPGPHLGICGHLDTKPVGEAADEWRSDPYAPTIEGDRMYGLGSCDMKGAVAAMIYAGAAFASVADRASGSLSLIFTADEEYGSAKGAGYLSENAGSWAHDLDAIVLGEPSGVREDWEAIRIVSRGVCGFKVSVEGTQMHSSISDQLPSVNAVEAMAKVLTGMRRDLKPRYPAHPLCPTGPTINLGVRTLGGVGYGVLPGHAEFWSDIRTTPGMTQETLREDLEAVLAGLQPEVPDARLSLEFHPGLGWLPPSEVAADHPVTLACASAGKQILGREIPLAAFPGGTDAASFQIIAGIPTIAALGPGLLPLAHGPNEWVSLTSLIEAARMYAVLAVEFGAGMQG